MIIVNTYSIMPETCQSLYMDLVISSSSSPSESYHSHITEELTTLKTLSKVTKGAQTGAEPKLESKSSATTASLDTVCEHTHIYSHTPRTRTHHT